MPCRPARKGIRASVLVGQDAVDQGRIEIGTIENVEHLSPELHGQFFSNAGILDSREVKINHTRPIDFVSPTLPSRFAHVPGEATPIEAENN